jgi:hypothetical protein
MKKKYLTRVLVAVIFMVGMFIGKSFLGTKPFRNLAVSEISGISVKLSPPDVIFELTDSEIEELVEILHTVIIYNEDNFYNDYVGQGVIFTIIKTDGTQMKATAYNPFFIIDAVGYRTKYEPCEKLNSWANELKYKVAL